jgi:large subunit ribosomal protein L25
MQTYTLQAKTRSELGKKVKLLRQQNILPAVVYGNKIDPISISISATDFDKTFSQAGTSALVDLAVDGKDTYKVLTHEPQMDPVTSAPIHVDFYRVRMDEKITTEIPLEFTGESVAVEQLGGTLVTPHDNIEVECLPNDLVSEISIDITPLKTFEDQIKLSDIQLPKGIETEMEPGEVLALVEAPRSEEELAELEKSAAEEEAEAVEKVAGEKVEGEEGAEGEAGEETPTEPESDGTPKPVEESKKN